MPDDLLGLLPGRAAVDVRREADGDAVELLGLLRAVAVAREDLVPPDPPAIRSAGEKIAST